MPLMRTRLLSLALLAAAACRPAVAVAPVIAPVARERAPEPLPAPESAPAPEPAPLPAPEPAPTWAWAVSVLPELAGHSEVEPGEAALARFVKWFPDGAAARVHVLFAEACHVIAGSMSADGFHGSWHRQVRQEGDERRVSAMSFDITLGGISESGPGGVIYRRDRKGRWQESGAYGTGYFDTLVDRPMTAADDQRVSFAGYSYRLEPVCRSREAITHTCIGGGTRSCERCTEVWLKPRAERMGWGDLRVKVGRVESVPVDCTQACPVDEWTPLLPRLATVLAGREFAGVLEGEGPVVFRSARGCIRELRRRKAAARKADEAAE